MLPEHPGYQVQCPQSRELIVFITTRQVIFSCVVGNPSCLTGKIRNRTPGKWRSFLLIIRHQRLGEFQNGSFWDMPY